MPIHSTAGLVLSEVQANFLQSGVSINVAGRGVDNSLSVSRAFGCLVSEDRCTVTIYSFSEHCEQLLKHIAENGVIAVVFSKPSSNETLQLKSTSARWCPLKERDLAAMAAWRRVFTEELLGLGYPPNFVQAMAPQAGDTAVGICFKPEQVFSQTPGPNAGMKLKP